MEPTSRSRTRAWVGAGALLLLGILAVSIGVTVVQGLVAPATPPSYAAPTSAVSEPAQGRRVVHVSGAVAAPGVYQFDEQTRVVDAIAAAGGFTDDADPGALNLAREVADGEQLHVPERGEAVTAAPGAPAGAVNINRADAAELDTLPRIGPALAERIVAWREENGPFAAVEDLLSVSGIGEKVLEELRGRVTT